MTDDGGPDRLHSINTSIFLSAACNSLAPNVLILSSRSCVCFNLCRRSLRSSRGLSQFPVFRCKDSCLSSRMSTSAAWEVVGKWTQSMSAICSALKITTLKNVESNILAMWLITTLLHCFPPCLPHTNWHRQQINLCQWQSSNYHLGWALRSPLAIIPMEGMRRL